MTEFYDNQFMESAYLSELWASYDIKNKIKQFGQQALDAGFQKQYEDELRHAQMIKSVMIIECGYNYKFSDVTFAMQIVIYHRLCGLDLSAISGGSFEMFKQVHEITERRAIWIYKTYMWGGNNERYKTVLKQIMKEEEDHFRRENFSNKVIESVKIMDKWAYQKYLPKYYNGMNLLKCKQFWDDYYGKGLRCPTHLD